MSDMGKGRGMPQRAKGCHSELQALRQSFPSLAELLETAYVVTFPAIFIGHPPKESDHVP